MPPTVGMLFFMKRPFSSKDDAARHDDHLFQTGDGLLDSVVVCAVDYLTARKDSVSGLSRRSYLSHPVLMKARPGTSSLGTRPDTFLFTLPQKFLASGPKSCRPSKMHPKSGEIQVPETR